MVDDNIDSADSMAELLRVWGHEVQAVHNGSEALAAAPAFRPEVALLDIDMPDMADTNSPAECGVHGFNGTAFVALTGLARKRITVDPPRPDSEHTWSSRLILIPCAAYWRRWRPVALSWVRRIGFQPVRTGWEAYPTDRAMPDFPAPRRKIRHAFLRTPLSSHFAFLILT